MKIWLLNFLKSSPRAAVEAALKMLGRNHIDLLILAVPKEAIPLLGVASVSGGQGQEEAIRKLLEIWRVIEELIGEGKVGGAGLCDLLPSVFISIYQQAAVKPTSVQVAAGGQDHWECQDVDNWESCCAALQELRAFAKANGVTLLAHWDPMEILPGDWIANMLYPGMAREEGQYSKTWVAR